jgi:hypothetical protein
MQAGADAAFASLIELGQSVQIIGVLIASQSIISFFVIVPNS